MAYTPTPHPAHARLKQKIMDPGFPCVAARSVINRQTYRLGSYGALGSSEAALAICHDLYAFSDELPPGQAQFTSFFAMFDGPLGQLTELEFEALLWRQLQLIHEVDARHFEWDATVSKDPDDPKFSFSVGGRAFFVVGLHQGASRLARKMAQPCLVFNPHDQFEALRAEGGYDRLQQAIRQRDMAYQGSINPVLTNFGQQTESRQYSGRSVPSQWECPFKQGFVSHDD
ncbi:MAG: hypothetical protein C0487_05615 [Leptothrix sp. (in: Bacteria)]|nr:hypothetical protein [Leptothrix sp. (in: b-proteobacteria)]